MVLEGRPKELHINVQPNQFLRFAYPVYNLDGTPYNEPFLTNVYLDVYSTLNRDTPLKRYSFANGISISTNIISFNVLIDANDLPIGRYYATINHVRTIGADVQNNVQFAGQFTITNEYRATVEFGNTINIVDVIGLRDELDLRLKYTVRTIGDGVTDEYIITVADGNFLVKPPLITIYTFTGIDNIVVNNSTSFTITFTEIPALSSRMVAIGYIPL